MADFASCKEKISKYEENQEQFARLMSHCESNDFSDDDKVTNTDYNKNLHTEKLKAILSKHREVDYERQKLLKERGSVLECFGITEDLQINDGSFIVKSIKKQQVRYSKIEHELSSLQSVVQEDGSKQKLITNEEYISVVQQMKIRKLDLENCFNEVDNLLRNSKLLDEKLQYLNPMEVVDQIKELQNFGRENGELSTTIETLQRKIQTLQRDLEESLIRVDNDRLSSEKAIKEKMLLVDQINGIKQELLSSENKNQRLQREFQGNFYY